MSAQCSVLPAGFNGLGTLYIVCVCVCVHGQACQKLFQWLKANAVWEGGKYTDVVIGEAYRPEGYTLVWCHNADLLC